MTRLLYVECKDGRPLLNEDGYSYCCESLTLVELEPREEWVAYAPAAVVDELSAELAAAKKRVLELEEILELADRDDLEYHG